MKAAACAIVLAAGRSSRMGRPKLDLPWAEGRTVLGQVVHVLLQAGLKPVFVVTGEQTPVGGADWPVEFVLNRAIPEADMLGSLQSGLRAAADSPAQAALVALGDQPQIELAVVQALLARFAHSHAGLLAPSYQMRRGHPWLIGRALWPEVLALQPPQTLRALFAARAAEVVYENVATDSILQDLDTPEDYTRYRGK